MRDSVGWKTAQVGCKLCMHFLEQSEAKFTRDGFKDWKHLTKAGKKHEDSKGHLHSHTKLAVYRESHQPNGRGTVFDQLMRDKENA